MVLGVLAVLAAAGPSSPQPQNPTAEAPMVRLRKIHLVRPDLIPYPIALSIYC